MGVRDNGDWTKVLGWPGYRVYQQEIDEASKALKPWVRRKKTGLKLICSNCGKHVRQIHEVYEREVRDLPVFQYSTTIVVELHWLRCPDCGSRPNEWRSYQARFPSANGLKRRSDKPVKAQRPRARTRL